MKAVFVFTAALFAASSAWAQSTQNPPAPTNGPLVLERIHDPWVLAPDFKVTDLDDPAPCRHRGLLHRRATGEHLVPTD